MKKVSLVASDLLQKEKLASLSGGNASTNKVCGCICVGPVTPVKVELNNGEAREVVSSDADCTDCGASNAHRSANELTVQ